MYPNSGNSNGPTFFSETRRYEPYKPLTSSVVPVCPLNETKNPISLFIGQVQISDTPESLTALLNHYARAECVLSVEIVREHGTATRCAFAVISGEDSVAILLTLHRKITYEVLDAERQPKTLAYVFERAGERSGVSSSPESSLPPPAASPAVVVAPSSRLFLPALPQRNFVPRVGEKNLFIGQIPYFYSTNMIIGMLEDIGGVGCVKRMQLIVHNTTFAEISNPESLQRILAATRKVFYEANGQIYFFIFETPHFISNRAAVNSTASILPAPSL